MKRRSVLAIIILGIATLAAGYYLWRAIDTKYPPTERRLGNGTVHIQITTVRAGTREIWPQARLSVALSKKPGDAFYYKTTIATNAQGQADLYLRQSDVDSTTSDLFILSLDGPLGTYDGHPTAGKITIELDGLIGG